MDTPTDPFYPLEYTLEIASALQIKSLTDLASATQDPVMKLAAAIAANALVQIRECVQQGGLRGDRQLVKCRDLLAVLPGDQHRADQRAMMSYGGPANVAALFNVAKQPKG